MKLNCYVLKSVGITFAMTLGMAAPAQRVTAAQASTRTEGSSASQKITVSVVVEDKSGHPVRGLQAGDFSLLDNAQPQHLAGFRAVDTNEPPSNPTHVLFVVDMINTDFETVAVERQQLKEYIHEHGDRLKFPTTIALMTTTGVKTMSGSTQDGAALLAKLATVETEMRAITQDGGFYGAAERLQKSVDQLNSLSSYEAKLPGRKLFLVLSPGWPIISRASTNADIKQRTATFDTIIKLTNSLREAQVVLYSINPYPTGHGNPFYFQNYLRPVTKAKQAEFGALSLQVLAEHSGGRALNQGLDILEDLRTAMQDAGPYYELTFEAPPVGNSNEYHELRVQTNTPDTKLLTTSGYYTQAQATDLASNSETAPK
jgi:VWFA-related protein